MSNLINFREKTCQCSNGCTDVLLTVIGLSGSRLARTDDERNMMVWLMMKDQNIVGRGTVGFDITEMLWEKEYFERQKQFMLRVLNGVKKRIGWETLSYEPNEEMIFNRIDCLYEMFQAIQIEDIDEEATREWLEDVELNEPIKNGYPKCEKHGIYHSIFGCIACNDDDLE